MQATGLSTSQFTGNPRAFIELTWKDGRTVGISTSNTLLRSMSASLESCAYRARRIGTHDINMTGGERAQVPHVHRESNPQRPLDRTSSGAATALQHTASSKLEATWPSTARHETRTRQLSSPASRG